MSLLLGIDTSCDDTGVGVVRGEAGRAVVLSNAVASQTALHARFGGVVPEQASREHLQVMDAVVQRALEESGVTLSEIDAVAATYGPGLVGALLVGLSYGKALAFALGRPFVPVHHLEGHIASSASAGELGPPFLCLIASGGHTSLFDVPAWGDYRELGRTRDDAAGEAFDKVARLLGLGFPGGPALSQAAESGDAERYPFPRPLQGQAGFDFSFSGLKTAAALLVQREPEASVPDVAASFERAVVESLVSVTARAAQAMGREDVVVAGGVAANRRLRARFAEEGLRLHFPQPGLATDNGAMIALAALHRLDAPGSLAQPAVPYLPLDERLRATASS